MYTTVYRKVKNQKRKKKALKASKWVGNKRGKGEGKGGRLTGWRSQFVLESYMKETHQIWDQIYWGSYPRYKPALPYTNLALGLSIDCHTFALRKRVKRFVV